MKENEFKCDYCHTIYEFGWTDEEARAEAKEVWGKDKDEWIGGAAIVCDDCYQKINPIKYPELVKEVKSNI